MPISKRNRRGLLLLLFIAALISYTPRIIAASVGDEELQITFEELELIEAEIDIKKEFTKEKKKKVWKSKYKSPTKTFDPNNYKLDDWMSLGLSEKQSEVILKFSKRGLRSNEDLEKIFVIPSELFKLIKDSTYYPEREYVAKFEKVVKKEFISVDINSANIDELKTIPGIGDFYATKIVEYRTKLGGYLDSKQLLEIWNFDSELYSKIENKIFLSDQNLNQIDINTATFDDLKVHPYISYKVANSIVKMRLSNGDYSRVEDILESKLIDNDLFLKIKKYLKV